MSGKTPKETLEWLLRDFAERVAHVQAAVVYAVRADEMHA